MLRVLTVVGILTTVITGIAKLVSLITGTGFDWADALAAYAYIYITMIAIVGVLDIIDPKYTAFGLPSAEKTPRRTFVAVGFAVWMIAVLILIISIGSTSLNTDRDFIGLPQGTTAAHFIGATAIIGTIHVMIQLVYDHRVHRKSQQTKCLFCRETIHIEATRCKHCQGDLIMYY
ncbi:hypothetical protein OJ997_03650 [Solirubrobacter phytolaccae]|uniref:Zinc ribbon domain-containing protein n=1 Tax=Solirubrobacter phytolaccae TaxID=1404360 RepID=A0A9X3N6V2_9ACTN|nr:hypothetical protein [Solirubrobacter phytolaccae]MDA0179379.1 hypothetical protein [Solirubrobacter phytolaccae]